LQGIDLVVAQQEGSPAAKSVISRCGAVNVNTIIYLPSSNSFLWNTPPIFCLPSIDYYYLFRLNNQETRIKTSMCVHHTFLAAVAKSCSVLNVPGCPYMADRKKKSFSRELESSVESSLKENPIFVKFSEEIFAKSDNKF
jgi:hypothetical protein